MAKKVNWTSNLRVDLDDLEQGTHGYSSELSKEFIDRTFKDAYPRVAEGFRVEIADAANRVITVYSGVATDQNGQLVNNEESQATARSITLTGDATYYIEVEFVETLGSTDARAFFDPTYDNGLDTSGDVLPDGRESSQNVATRKTHDWQIVDPPSTTGFQVTTTAGGSRIPVAVITVSGGAITAPVGTSVARTTFARTYSSGVGSIRCLNTRIFPDSFTARLGSGTANQEDISVDANDREHGILSFNGVTAFAHDVGERVLNQGSTVLFIDEAVAMDDAAGVDGGGPIPNVAGDGRIRMFQGDTEAGYALSQDPSSDTGESDIQVKSLKEKLDYLASQVLEMKYGAGSRDLLGTLAPPSSFTAADTTHYARSGGIIPARAHTVSVGNGTTTWGDYNTTTSGSAQAAIQAAIDALPVNGGIVYVKAGTYTITATAISIVDKPVWLIGDGRDATVIDATGAVSAIDFDTATATQEWSSMLRMDNLSVTYSGGFTGGHAMTCTGAGSRMMLKNCRVYGIDATIQVGRSTFEHCRFRQTTAATDSTLEGRFNECTFLRCYIDMDAALAAERAVLLTSGSDRLVFDDCTFQTSTTPVAMVELAADNENIVFRNCEWATASGVLALELTAAGGSDILLDHCNILCDGGVATLSGSDNVKVLSCSIAVPQDDPALRIDTSSTDIVVDGCTLTQATTSSITSGFGIKVDTTDRVRISNNSFLDCDYGVELGGSLKDVSIVGNTITQTSIVGSKCRRGVTSVGGGHFAERLDVSNNEISYLNDNTAADLVGIYLDTSGISGPDGSVVSNNQVAYLGDAANATPSYGIWLESTGAGAQTSVVVSGNTVSNLNSSGSTRGIFVERAFNVAVNGNTVFACAADNSANTLWRGIEVLDCRSGAVNSNTIRQMGHSTNTAANCVGIRLGDNAVSSQSSNVSVTGNSIAVIRADSSVAMHGIYVDSNFEAMSISSNTVDITAALGVGIGVNTGAASTDVSDITVVGNVIRGTSTTATLEKGVELVINDTTANEEGHVAVANNIITNFDDSGIIVVGSATVGSTKQASVVGNVLYSISSLPTTGVSVRQLTGAVVNSNSITFATSAASNHSLIFLRTIQEIVVSGNHLKSDSTGTTIYGVDTDATSSFGAVTGNMVRALASTGTASEGFNTPGTASTVFFSGNVVKLLAGTNPQGSGGGTTNVVGDPAEFNFTA